MFSTQVCEMGGIPNLGETPVLVRPMQNCAASLRTPFVRRQSNRKSAWQKRRFLTVRGTSQELRRYVQNWTAPCVKFDAPLFDLNIQEPSETQRNACLTLDVPLPVVVLNEYVRKHFSMLMELSDSVSLSNAGGRLRIKCTVCGLWEE